MKPADERTEHPLASEPPSRDGLIDAVCDRFEAAWKANEHPRIEDYLEGPPAAAGIVPELLPQLVMVDLEYRWRAAGPAALSPETEGQSAPTHAGALPPRHRLEDYAARYPALNARDVLPLEPCRTHNANWALATRGDNHVIEFFVKIDANAPAAALASAVRGVVEALLTERDTITALVAAEAIDSAAVIGRWRASAKQVDGSARQFELELRADGSFVWDQPSRTMRGTFAIVDGQIFLTIDGEKVRLGIIQSADERQMVLGVGQTAFTFVRQQQATEAPPAGIGPAQPDRPLRDVAATGPRSR